MHRRPHEQEDCLVENQIYSRCHAFVSNAVECNNLSLTIFWSHLTPSQVPKSRETLQGVDPRNAFVPTKKGTRMLFSCDYSQKEVRILAHMCSDKALMSLFHYRSVDIYKQMASLIRSKPIGAVSSEERSQFKQVTLAILYGMSPKQVAKKLNISETAAFQIMRDFFHKFSGLKKWMDETKEFARQNHYVLTIAGRRRYLDAISSNDRAQKSQAERQAINTVIQGSAADLMKTAMIKMSENLQKWKGPPSERPHMLLQIHDELILELNFDKEHIFWLKEIALKSCCWDCEKYFGLKIPLVLDCSCGLSWQSMKHSVLSEKFKKASTIPCPNAEETTTE